MGYLHLPTATFRVLFSLVRSGFSEWHPQTLHVTRASWPWEWDPQPSSWVCFLYSIILTPRATRVSYFWCVFLVQSGTSMSTFKLRVNEAKDGISQALRGQLPIPLKELESCCPNRLASPQWLLGLVAFLMLQIWSPLCYIPILVSGALRVQGSSARS